MNFKPFEYLNNSFQLYSVQTYDFSPVDNKKTKLSVSSAHPNGNLFTLSQIIIRACGLTYLAMLSKLDLKSSRKFADYCQLALTPKYYGI